MPRPSTQMSMFHFGEWRAPGAWRRSGGEEFRRVRKSRAKCCWSVSGREKVRLEMTEGRRERDGRRVCSCSVVTKSRLLFILACESQQPPHIRCEIGGGWGGKGERDPVVTASECASLNAAFLCLCSRRASPLRLLCLAATGSASAARLRCS